MCVCVCVHAYVCVHLHLHACFVWTDKSFCCVFIYVVCMLSHGVGAVHIYLRRFMYRCAYICTTLSKTSTGGVATEYVEECLFVSGIPFLCLPHAGNTGMLPSLLSFSVGPGIWTPAPMVTSHTLYLLNHLSLPSTYLISHIPMSKNFFFKRLALNANLESAKHGGSNIFFLSVKQLHWAHTEPHAGLDELSVLASVSLSGPHVRCWRDLISFLNAKIFCHNLNFEDAVPAAVY